MQPFLEAFEELRGVRAACEQTGVGKSTVYRTLKRDEHFAAAFADVDERLVADLEDELRRLAFEGTKDDNVRRLAIVDILKARRPDLYSERHRVEHSGQIAQGGAIDYSTATDEELRAVIAEAERATENATTDE
jgi:hypothetical protein